MIYLRSPRQLLVALALAGILALFATPAFAGQRVERDSYCVNDDGVSVGVVLAGTEVTVLEQKDGKSLIFSERHGVECWIDDFAFEPLTYIHPVDLEKVMRWRGIVERWLPSFPDTLTEELVLSIIFKETHGNPRAVDGTGNDIRLVGAASVGVMGAIPRPHLPCYEQLTGPNKRSDVACQIYLGMYILDSAIWQAHELRTGNRISFAVSLGTIPEDRVCTATLEGEPVGWLREGEQIEVLKVIQNVAGIQTHARIYSERHGRNCWVSLDGVTFADAPESEDEKITPEDVEMGIWLYGCTLENVLADNCLSWGRDTYSDLVLNTIMPEITDALKGQE